MEIQELIEKAKNGIIVGVNKDNTLDKALDKVCLNLLEELKKNNLVKENDWSFLYFVYYFYHF